MPDRPVSYPLQETDIRCGDVLHVGEQKLGTVDAICPDTLTVDIKKTKVTRDLHPPAAFEHKNVTDDVLSDSPSVSASGSAITESMLPATTGPPATSFWAAPLASSQAQLFRNRGPTDSPTPGEWSLPWTRVCCPSRALPEPARPGRARA